MSIGTRIMEIRKKNNLSQEAFGETLGVSRQAISKWEMDASIPDVDKLILMSQLYEVSVGYILGVEEKKATQAADEADGPSKNADHGGNELTPQQLRMVEEIVDRYLEAMPRESEITARKYKRLQMAVCGIAVLCAVLLMGWRYSIHSMNRRFEYLSGNVLSVYGKVDELESSVTNRLESQLKNVLDDAYETLLNHGWEVVDYDMESDTLTLRVYAEARTYNETTQATFVVVGERGETRFDATREDGVFSAEIHCPCSDVLELRLLLTTDGVTENKFLENLDDLLRVEMPENWVFGGSSMLDLTLEHNVLQRGEYKLRMSMDPFMKGEIGTAQPGKVSVTYYVNNEKYVEFEGPVEIADGKAHWEQTIDLEIPLEEGDVIVDVITVTDTMGRRARMIRESYRMELGQLTACSANLKNLPE